MIKRFMSSVLLSVMLLTAAPVTAGAAFNPFGSACQADKAGESVACTVRDKDKNGNAKDEVATKGPKYLLLRITSIVAYVAGAIAVIMIIAGAIRFVTAGSDVSTGSRTDTDIEDARRSIAAALAGLVVIVLAQLIIAYAIRNL
jgi:hypothetical protein